MPQPCAAPPNQSKDNSDSLYLALDQGGSRSRALIFNHQGQPIAHAEQTIDTYNPNPGWIEHDPQQRVASLQECATDATNQLPASLRQQIRSWGLACQRASLIGWHKLSGQPLTPVLSWQDSRGLEYCDWDDQQRTEIQHRTGLYPSPHHGASKMRWLLANNVEVEQAAAEQRLQLAPLASYLAMALTRSSSDQETTTQVDAANAQRTLLWNRHTQDWDDSLLSWFGIDRAWLPATAPCLGQWGDLNVAGLRLPGRFVGGDQGCGHFGRGQPQARSITINLGTGGFISLPVSANRTQPAGLLLSLVTSDRDAQQWMVEATINGAGAALSWLQQQDPATDLQPFFRQPLQPQPGLFLNAVSGLGSPFWRSDLSSCFINSHTLKQRYSAVIDSILFLIQLQLGRLQQGRHLRRWKSMVYFPLELWAPGRFEGCEQQGRMQSELHLRR